MARLRAVARKDASLQDTLLEVADLVLDTASGTERGVAVVVIPGAISLKKAIHEPLRLGLSGQSSGVTPPAAYWL